MELNKEVYGLNDTSQNIVYYHVEDLLVMQYLMFMMLYGLE